MTNTPSHRAQIPLFAARIYAEVSYRHHEMK